MPTTTFYRLPEEKRQRVLDAAWNEFTQTEYGKASINRIVRAAGIPRGSFYQYFQNKEDLFSYMMRDIRAAVLRWSEARLREDGDVFSLYLAMYDAFFTPAAADPQMDRLVCLLRRNPTLNWSELFRAITDTAESAAGVHALSEKLPLRRREAAFESAAVTLLSMATALAVLGSLSAPEQQTENREKLKESISIIQHGALQSA